LSQASLNVLTVNDIGVQIQNALGVSADDIQTTSGALLLSLMPDDSGSISSAGNEQAVCDGHNLIRDAILNSKSRDSVLMLTQYLNGYILNPYQLIENALAMNLKNYSADKGTPLYDNTVVLLGSVLAKAEEFKNSGVPARTITLVITDGHDEHSRKCTERDVAAIVRDMLRTESHIVAAMGIDDGGHTNFRKIFGDMGIQDKWILTPKNSQSEIRAACQVFSQSAVRASQNAGSFSQTALGGGFATP
jgi:hypothetical protein